MYEKRTALIFINDINLCPYVDKYVHVLNRLNVKHDFIIWDRSWNEGKKYKYDCAYIYKNKSPEDTNRIIKLFDFIGFRNFVTKIVKENKYNHAVFLSTLSALMLPNRYRKQLSYVLDYRDASYEWLPFFAKKITQIINNAYFTAISSPGFLELYPSITKWYMAHNFRYEDYNKHFVEEMHNNDGDKIVVSYIGELRQFNYMKKLVDIFGNDDRFILNVHGRGGAEIKLKQYANNFTNVYITGKYSNEEKYLLIGKSDILCYSYPPSFNNNRALANKYYDAIIYKKPLLGDIRTYSGKLLEENGLGISLVDDDPEFKDKIYAYFKSIDPKEFSYHANVIMNRVLNDDKIYMEKINEFFNK